MSKIRIGLIGFGEWARNAYLPALQCDGRAMITAITASSEKTRQLAREILGDDVVIFENYQELLCHAKIDAVMIGVPDRVHEAALSAAIDAGVAVFYEPPIAHTRKQIPVMLDRLLKAEQVTYAHIELSSHPGIKRAVELIKNKTIGSLHNVTINLTADWGCSNDADLCLLDRMSSWYVDVLNHIIGSVPTRVLVLDGHGSMGRMQTISTGIYDYNGVHGFIKANVDSPAGLSITMEIVGDEGEIYIDYFSGEFKYRSKQNPEWIVEDCSPLKPYANWPGVRETVSSFIDAVISGDKSMGNAQAIVVLNQIGLASDESVDIKNWVEITF